VSEIADLSGRPVTDRTTAAIRDVLAGRKRGVRSSLLFAGPAVVASVAYMDPGNFATNIQAGAHYGYALLWVVVLANLIAMLFQGLSAKLGIVTGRNLAEVCRAQFPRWAVYGLWAASEIAAMATDLAEFVGGAIGLALLFRIPLLAGMAVTATVTYGVLLFEKRGYRVMELIVGALVAAIGLCFLVELAISPVAWKDAGLHAVLPSLPGVGALTVAIGIVGATVMPHALYLHSGLTQNRAPARSARERRSLLRFSNREVVVALAFAGLINMSMVMMASSAFHTRHSGVTELESAYRILTPLLGAGAAGVFLCALIASGVSSSVVGTMAGQMIMQGFTGVRVPIWVRRSLVMLPAFAVVAIGFDGTRALILSQVVLSFILPVPMVTLVLFTSRRDIMGEFANGFLTNAVAVLGAFIVLALNFVLLVQAFGLAAI